MKKIRIILSVLALAALFSCVKEGPENLTSVVLAQEIELSFSDDVMSKIYVNEEGESVYPIKVGESATLSFTISPAAADLTSKEIRWSSSNEKVATVDQNGKITAVSAGSAGIRVSQYPFSVNASASLTVSVYETAVPATAVAITVPAERETDDSGTPIVYEAEELQMTAVVGPEDCTFKTVTWSVDKPEFATIDPIKGILKGIKAGTIVVTAVGVVDKEAKANLTMYVAKSIDPEGVMLTEPAGPLSVSDGTYKMIFTTYPAVCTKSRIEWTSSDPDVATVEKGIVTINKYGEVDITASCPNGKGGGGMDATSTVKLVIPAGYYHEHLENPDLWITKTAGATKEVRTSDAGEKYLYIVPNKANANTGRGDFGHAGVTFASRQYPIVTFRMDDVNDRMDENGKGKFARNINLDTSGEGEDGTKFSGNVGGNNNKWYKKIVCTDGSCILVYDLSTQSFPNGGVLPENNAAKFTTWQIKYADIRNSDKADIQDINNFSYRFFWFHTFKSMDEFNAYLQTWYAQYGIDYEGNPNTAVPDAGVKFAKTADVASISDATYKVAYETSPDATPLNWTSSNEEVATVSDGVITLKGVYGTTTITATVAVDGEAPAGYAHSATLELTVPIGFYQEHMEDETLWKLNQNGTTEFKTSDKEEKYLSIIPFKSNDNTGRGDIKRQKETLLNRSYPIVTFRVDDLNDFADEVGGKFSRAINMDTSGADNDNPDNKFSGNVGGDNNKWKVKYKCSDGSAILVYDLSTQGFKNGGILPEGVNVKLTTFQIKYADLRNSDKSNIQDIAHFAYRFFWFHTFASMSEMDAYLASWSAKTGITYE